ncbi:hypothetical protein J437_LFUL009900 [Ladona fulva]|uniref:Uncharacterized protein n=1 Tax=Ladona fulva TaxID=123851 RepID=A0A8K0NVK2_LADFU|nr:hypothetical protein J437_LFUL009900 [Ladona fulva]
MVMSNVVEYVRFLSKAFLDSVRDLKYGLRPIVNPALNIVQYDFQWYECDLRDLPSHLVDRFVQMSPDEETEAFLEQSREKSNWVLTQLWHSFARSVLGWFMTQTSING